MMGSHHGMSGTEVRHSPYRLTPVPEAIETILQTLEPVSSETIPVTQSLGRILTKDIKSLVNVPPYRASTRDGYAVVSNDGAGEYPLVGESVAGAGKCDVVVKYGQVAYVATGGEVPEGADAVAMVEWSKDVGNGRVRFERWVKKTGDNVRDVGVDVGIGDVLVKEGECMGAVEIGLVAGCGVGTVEVRRRVKVGVMSTGDEVVDLNDVVDKDGQVEDGKIVDSNRPMLLALIDESLPQCKSVDLGIVRDDKTEVKRVLMDAFEKCDIVLTSGGVSMGNRDLIKPIVEETATMHFGRVLMKPGKPLTYATVPEKNTCFIGLPGNPVSSFVCFHLAVVTAARRLGGWSKEKAKGPQVKATLTHSIRLDPERPEYHRATLKVK